MSDSLEHLDGDAPARRISDRWDERHPDDEAQLRRVLDSGSMTGTSPSVAEYEAAIAAKYGKRFALAVSSGWAALLVALVGAVADLADPARRGRREIILAPTSPLCTVYSLLELRVEPIFVDVREDSFGLDPAGIEAALSPNTVGILEVPMWGYPISVDITRQIADRHGLPHILDLAHGPMTSLHGRGLASFGDVASYSTHSGKYISTGEGGMVVTDDPEMDARMRAYTRFGNLNGKDFGLNFKGSGPTAALGLARLQNLEPHAAVRRRNRRYILDRLCNPHIREVPIIPGGLVSAYALLLQAVDGEGRRLVGFLDRRGIPSDIKQYDNKNLYEYPVLAGRRRDCPRAAALLRSLTTVPLHPDLTEEDLNDIVDAINEYAPSCRERFNPVGEPTGGTQEITRGDDKPIEEAEEAKGPKWAAGGIIEPIESPTRADVVVIGGSTVGCAFAAALASAGKRVTIVEREAFAETADPRRFVPQEGHVHLVLRRGMLALERFIPWLGRELMEAGAEVIDQGHGLKRYHRQRWVSRYPTGIPALYCTRHLLDQVLRRRVAALPNVAIRPGTRVDGLVFSPDGPTVVTGVMVTRDGRCERLDAGLVVDASGRGSLTGKWLAEAGIGPVPESQVHTDLGYASRLYRRRPEFARQWGAMLVLPTPPREKAMGVISPVEDGRWLVTTGGWFGAYPTDEADFLPFLRQRLPVPDIFEIVSQAEPLSDISLMRLPGSRWRHFELLANWPDGLLVAGDALCCLNPLYSQGITIGAMQAEVIAEAARGGRPSSVAQARLADVVRPAWEMARAEDLRHPDTAGPRPLGLRLRHWYGDRFAEAAVTDRLALQTLVGVTNLVIPGRAMYRPAILARVAAAALARATTTALPVGGAR